MRRGHQSLIARQIRETKKHASRRIGQAPKKTPHMLHKLKIQILSLVTQLNRFAPDAPLLARLSVGALFFQSGWGKIHHLERTTSFFNNLGIPAPAFHAILVGNVEWVGGILLLLGLATRAISLPLIVTMSVAIGTSALGDVEGVLDFLALDEFLYLAVLLWLMLVGAGRWSVDHLLRAKLLGPARDSAAHTN